MNNCYYVSFIWCPALLSMLNQTWNVSTIFCETLQHQMFNPYPANVEIGWAPNNASKWQMGFHLAFKGLKMSNADSEAGMPKLIGRLLQQT